VELRPVSPPRPADVRTTGPLLVLAGGIFAYGLLQALVTPVLSTFTEVFATDRTTTTWILTAYLLSASIATPVLGRLGDSYGKKRMLLVCLGFLFVGCGLAAVAPSIEVMIAARAVQGVAGGVLPLAFGIVRDTFPPARVPGAVGLIAAQAAVGGGLGTVLAGPIVDLLDWHWLFWIPMAATAVAVVAAVRVVPESGARTAQRLPLVPTVLLSAWLVCLLLGLSQGPAWGWGSVAVVGLLVASALGLAAWIVTERRAANPLVDVRVMRRPAVWSANLVTLLLGVSQFALFAFMPQILLTPTWTGYGFGLSLSTAGLLLLPGAVTMFVGGTLAGRLTARFGARRTTIGATALTTLPLAGLVVDHGHLWQITGAMAVTHLGFGITFASVATVVVQGVPRAQTGAASGMNANIRTVGGSLGTAVMAAVVTAGVVGSQFPPDSGYSRGFAVLTLAALLSVAAAVAIPRRLHG
jgi:EmrB/QacA subfamily drug resistance transporter